MLRFFAITLLVAATASAQVTYLGFVGTGQTVPDPVFIGNSSVAHLSGYYCTVTGLTFTVSGLPVGYNTASPITDEFIWFALDSGPSSLPGVSILGGQFYIPFNNYVLLGGLPSQYLGPGGIVLCAGLILLPGPVAPWVPNGTRTTISVPPGNFGVLTMQGFVLDPAINRIYTTNAINFSIP